jgi:Tfp pilus assembly protein PilO
MTFRRIINEKRALIWPLLLVLFANAVLYALVVYPLSQKVAAGEQDANAATAALHSARREYANARATVAGKSQADTELAKFYQEVLPPDLSGARRITYLPLDQLAKASGLSLQRQSADPSRVRDSTLHKLTQIAVLTGDYREIRQFLHKLETAPEFIVLENVSLAQNESGSDRGITVTVQVATYYRTGADGN